MNEIIISGIQKFIPKFNIEHYKCPICLGAENYFSKLEPFLYHINIDHQLDLIDFCKSYNVSVILGNDLEIEGFEEYNYDIRIKGTNPKFGNLPKYKFKFYSKDSIICYNTNTENGILKNIQFFKDNGQVLNVEVKEVKKIKPYIRIGEEIVKRIKIGNVYSYKRRMTKRKRLNGELKVISRGLSKRDLTYIPEVDDSFQFTESFHKQTIELLQEPKINSVLLSGDTGLGKTETVKQICARMNQPVLRLKITGNTKVKDIFQDENYSKEESKIIKIDKGIIKAMKNGWLLLVDEISAASPSVNFIFFELLENGIVTDFNDEVIYPKDTFKVVFTDNRIGNPNYYKYHGTLEQNAAFINRIESVIMFDNLPSRVERKILEKKFEGIDENFLTKLLSFSDMLRNENKAGNFINNLPIRTLEKICKNYLLFNNENDALYVGYINALTEHDDKVFVNDICNRVFGSNLFPTKV